MKRPASAGPSKSARRPAHLPSTPTKRRDWQHTFRERALASVPDEYAIASLGVKGAASPMQLVFELLAVVRIAHRDRNETKLAAIYDFAAWCNEQPEKPIWNAVGVAFYEHLLKPGDESHWREYSRFFGAHEWETVLNLSEFRYGSSFANELRAFRKSGKLPGGHG